MITSPESITDDLFGQVRVHFSEGEVVELCFFVLFYNMLHRFNTAIGLEPADGENIVVRHLGDFQMRID